nr:DUF86 domain-containing protein [Rheinheimera sp. YQF-1]
MAVDNDSPPSGELLSGEQPSGKQLSDTPPDDVLLNKAATIERSILRALEEYNKNPATFATDFTRQDAAILNIQRACEAALDMGQHLIRLHKLGVPQSSRDVFSLLATAEFIPAELADNLKKNWFQKHRCARISTLATGSDRTCHSASFTGFSAVMPDFTWG